MPLGFIKDYYDNKRAIARDKRALEASDHTIRQQSAAAKENITWNSAALDDLEERRLAREIKKMPLESSALDEQRMKDLRILSDGEDPEVYATKGLAAIHSAEALSKSRTALKDVRTLEKAEPYLAAKTVTGEKSAIDRNIAEGQIAQSRGLAAQGLMDLQPSATASDIAVNQLQGRQANSSAMDVDAVRNFQAIKRGAEEAGIKRSTRLTQKSDEMGLDTQALMTKLAELQAVMKTSGLLIDKPERSREFHPPASNSGFNPNSIDGTTVPTSSQGPRGGSPTNRAVGKRKLGNIRDFDTLPQE